MNKLISNSSTIHIMPQIDSAGTPFLYLFHPFFVPISSLFSSFFVRTEGSLLRPVLAKQLRPLHRRTHSRLYNQLFGNGYHQLSLAALTSARPFPVLRLALNIERLGYLATVLCIQVRRNRLLSRLAHTCYRLTISPLCDYHRCYFVLR